VEEQREKGARQKGIRQRKAHRRNIGRKRKKIRHYQILIIDEGKAPKNAIRRPRKGLHKVRKKGKNAGGSL